MSRAILPTVVVGNEFIMPQPKLQVAAPVVVPQTAMIPAVPILEDVVFDFEKIRRHHHNPFHVFLELLHRYSLGAFALLFMIVAAAAIQVGALYWSAHIALDTTVASTGLHLRQPLRGPNTTVATSQLGEQLQHITGQSLNLTIADKTLPVSGETIKSWLQIVSDKKKGVAYIHVNDATINKSIQDIAAPLIKAPTDQVTATYNDGTSKVISAGKNGTKLGDTSETTKQIAQSLLSAKGLQLIVPTETQAFAAVTPAAYDKLIEVNVVTKQMYLYDKGQLSRTYPVSAGAPETPTPIGQYKIYQKLSIQDMRGFNANGTKYFQPHVRWVNYFLPGGYAIHGNYWRPSSWFGAINSSHGCVSLPDDQAKEVYDWAPLGTTVITHY